ncbi:hypothetical protein AWB80_01337 [Caballeronia pedi]|uniref:Uncharacterized protein n=1 Tax=Caballeronia pedi TaxID=1777141 RepID=A0A157ZV59_9BURK|nr:HAD domain-containing protein [Caballeronia pedi]SAK49359.1 hypothetical protein AWB80_01337 [Caballeronia pedi]
MILYLALEGVLLPVDCLADLEQRTGFDTHRMAMLEPGLKLATILEPFPGIEIVLNTWWTYYIGTSECRKLLPKALAKRVIGAVLARPSRYDAFPNRPSAAENHLLAHGYPQLLLLDHIHARYSTAALRYTLLIHDVTRWHDPHLIDTLEKRLRKLTQAGGAQRRRGIVA